MAKIKFKSGNVKKTKTNKWASNVLKSMGYTATDVISATMPNTIDIARNNTQIITDIVRSAKTMKTSNRRLLSAIGSNEYTQLTREAIKNAKEDLRTGNINNRDRANKVIMGDLGDDFDFDFDEGGDDFSSSVTSETGEDGSTTNVVVNTNINENNPMVVATNKQTKAILETAEASQNAQFAIANRSIMMDSKMLETMSTGMQAINDNVGSIVSFNADTMSKFTAASLAFYEDTSKNLKEINETLKSMSSNSSKAAGLSGETRLPSNSYEMDVFSNGFSLEGYKKLVQKQLKSSVESNALAGPIKTMLEDKDTLKALAANPLAGISSIMIGSFLPAMFMQSAKRLDDSIKEFMPAMLTKLGGLTDSDNPLLAAIGEIFGVRGKTKRSVDFSRYNKGPTPFDGQTKKAIVDVIPTYLRKILSAVSSQPEIAMDWEKGEFRKLSDIKKEWDNTVRSTSTGAVSDIVSKMESRLNAIEFANREDKKALEKNMHKAISAILRSDAVPNLNANDDSLKDIYDMGNSSSNRLLKQMIKSLSKSEQMRLFGSGRLQSRTDISELFAKAEEGMGENNIFSILGDTSGGKTFKAGVGSMVGADKFGITPAMYLRDIRSLLTDGIMVFSGGNISATGNTSLPAHLSNARRKYGREKKEYEKLKHPDRTDNHMDSDALNRLKRNSRIGVNSIYDLDDISNEQLMEIFSSVDEENSTDKPIKSSMGKRWALIKGKVQGTLQAPAKLLAGLFDRVDDALYKMVFGNEDGGTTSFFISAFNKLSDKVMSGMERTLAFMEDKFFKPVREFLVEGENSLKARFDRSDLKKKMKAKWDQAKEYVLGAKTGENGAREGGLLSATYNEFRSMGLQMKNYITGAEYVDPVTGEKIGKNEDSVFSHFNGAIKSYLTSMKHYLFGDKDNPDGRGVLGEGFARIKEGFQSWSDAIFGYSFDKDGNKVSNIYVGEFTKDIKQRAPKSLAMGMMGAGVGALNMLGGGLLPSLFLPGGPIGGMLVGTTIGFLSQSENFKNMLFGKEVDGERVGGFVSKETQEFFKKHKDAMIGGASLGALKSMLGIGILPGIVGGPITGAALGIGSSLLFRSETFKRMLFGEEVDGKRVGGIAGKIAGFIKDENGNNVFGKVGAGVLGGAGIGLVASKFGLLGSLFLGGPLGGAMMGLAGGLALTNDKWKKALFGEWDPDNHIRKGGVFGKFINWTKLQIFEPLKLKFEEINLNIGEWFEKSIGNRFADAVYPIKKEFENMVESMKELFRKGWENFTTFLGSTFEKYVGKPFGEVMEEKILKPLKKFFGGIVNGVGRFAGAILSSPFKALTYVADGLQGKHERQGVSKMRENAMDALFDPTKRKEGQGLFGAAKDVFKAYFSAATIEAAKEAGAPYAKERREAREKRDRETEEKWAAKKAKLRGKQLNLEERIALAKGRDYDNVYIDANGNEVVDTSLYGVVDNSVMTKSKTPNKLVGLLDNNATFALPKAKNLKGVQFPSANIGPGATLQHHGMPTGALTPADITKQKQQSSGSGDKLVEGSKPVLNSSGGFKAGSIMKGSPQMLLGSIAKDVRTIASEIYGQFDGVGSNVYKIRKIVQGTSGIEDDDIAGSANRDRKGFGGKIRSLLYRPFAGILGMGAGIKNGVMSVVDGVLSLPKQIFGAFRGLISDVYTGLKNVGKSLLGIPALLVDGVKLGIKSLGAIIGAIGPMIGRTLEGVGTAIGATISGIGHTLEGAGKALGIAFEESAKAVGSLVKGIAEMVPVLFKFATGMFEFAGKALIKTATGVFNGIFNLASDALGIITAPIKMLGGAAKGIGDRILPHKVKTVISGSEATLPVKVVNAVKIAGSGGGSGGPSLPGISLTAANEMEESKISSAEIVSSHTGNESDVEKEESRAAELEERQADVTSETAAKRKAEAEFKSKEERQQEYQEEVVKNLKKNTEATTEHTSIWSSIFGSKGKITSLLLLGVPMILAILKNLNLGEIMGNAMKSLWDFVGHKNDESRQTETGEIINDQTREEYFPKVGGKILVRGLKNVGKISARLKNVMNTIRTITGRGAKTTTDDVMEAVVKSNTDEVIEAGLKNEADDIAAALIKNGTDDAVGAAIKGSSKSSSIVKSIGSFIDDLVKAGVNAGKKLIKDDSLLSKIASAVSSFIKKYLPKLNSYVDDLAKAVSKDGVKFGSGVGDLIQLAFSVYDLTTGAMEASRIFKVPKDYPITLGMRFAASLTKFLFGLTATGMVIHTVLLQVANIDLQVMCADIIMGMIDGNTLTSVRMARDELKYRTDEFNQEHGTNISVDAYQDLTNPSVFAKFFGRDKLSSYENGEITLSEALEGSRIDNTGRGRMDTGRSASRGSAQVVNIGNRGIWNGKSSSNTKPKSKFSWMDIITGRKDYNRTSKEKALQKMVDTAEFNKVIDQWKAEHPGEEMPYAEYYELKRAWGISWETQYEREHKFEASDYMKDRKKKIDDNKKKNDAALARRPQASKYKINYDPNGIDIGGKIKGWAKNTFSAGKELASKGIDASIKFAERQIQRVSRMQNHIKRLLKGEESIFKMAESIMKSAWNGVQSIGGKLKGIWGSFIGATSTDVDLRGDRNNQVASTRIGENFMKNKYAPIYSRLGLKGSGNMKYYSQKDPKWSSFGVGGGRMSDLGCGPTAMAMVASSMGVNANPAMMQHFANTGGFADSGGVNANFINSSANALGIRANQVLAPGVGNIAAGLQRGPMILLGRNGQQGSPYTNAGHYVVATKAGNGFVNIKDPNGPSGNKRVPISSLGGTMSAWSFEGSGPKQYIDPSPGRFRPTNKTSSSGPSLLFGPDSFTATDTIKKSIKVANARAATASKTAKASSSSASVGDGSLMYDNGAEFLNRDTSNAMTPNGGPAGEQVSNFMMSLEGRFKYSQKAGRENPEKSGYSDCSSTCAYCYRMVAGINTGGWTGAMLSHGAEVMKNTAGDKGFLQRPEVLAALKPGDLIIFGRGNKTAHVEMYVGNGQLSGHGGPRNGPTRKDIMSYKHKYPVLQIRRYCDDAGNALKPGDKVGVGNLNGMNTGSDPSTGGIIMGFVTDLGKLIGRVLFGEEDSSGSASSGMGHPDGGNYGAGINRSLKQFSPITAQQLNAFIDSKAKGKSGKLHGMGQAIIDASNATGLDPRYILAHAAWESGWGTSKTALKKNNFFGIGAYNKAPFASAKTFSGGPAEGLMAGAKWINNRYINGGADTLYKMITMSPPGPYCVDDNGQPSMSWANGIYGIMSQMSGAGSGGISLGDGGLLPQPSSVVLGQNRAINGGRVPVRMTGAGRGNMSSYSASELREMISILRSIDTNTGNTSTKLGVLIDKNGRPLKGSGSGQGNVTNVNVSAPKQYLGDKSPTTSDEQSKSYQLAKQIAKGKLA